MCRTYEYGTKARLSFSAGPHAPVNMADSMESAGSPKELQGFAQAWHTKYSIVQHSKRAISCICPPTFTSSMLSTAFTAVCGPPEKLSPRFCCVLIYVLRMIVKQAYHGSEAPSLLKNKCHVLNSHLAADPPTSMCDTKTPLTSLADSCRSTICTPSPRLSFRMWIFFTTRF